MIKQNKYIIFGSLILFIIVFLVITGWGFRIINKFPTISFRKFIQNHNELSDNQIQSKITSLEAEVASLLYLKSENELLKSAVQTKNETGITPIQAKIITFDNDFTRSSALVDVGSKDGVEINQPIIYLGHLIGIVKEVKDSSSKIQFLNDSEIKLAVSIQNNNNSQGVLKSQFGTVLEIDSVSKLEIVNLETNIITLANEKIPAGLLIGKVKSISEGDLFHKIIVDYPIDFYKLREVFILKT